MIKFTTLQKGFLGAITSIVIAVAGWSFKTTEAISRQTEQIETLEANVHILGDQYMEFNTNLMALIHKQDKRLTVVEYILMKEHNLQVEDITGE